MARKRICGRGKRETHFLLFTLSIHRWKRCTMDGNIVLQEIPRLCGQWRQNKFESGGKAPVWSESGGGHRSGVKHWKKIGCAPPLLVSAFVVVSTVWSVSCLLFFYSRCPPCVAICKSGRHVSLPHAPWSRRHCVWSLGRLDGLLCQLKLKFTLSSFIPTKIQITFIS